LGAAGHAAAALLRRLAAPAAATQAAAVAAAAQQAKELAAQACALARQAQAAARPVWPGHRARHRAGREREERSSYCRRPQKVKVTVWFASIMSEHCVVVLVHAPV
jgi:hypothetical protein